MASAPTRAHPANRLALYDVPPPGPWAERGRCRGPGSAVDFFSPEDERVAEATALCHRCPVKVECLAYALTHPALAGVWGGTDDAQRRRLRRAMAPTPTTRRPRRVEPRTADRLRTDEYRVISGLVDAGADALGVSAEALLGPGQSRPLCHYRQAVMFAARLLTNASYPTLGRAFGRDSSTVIHACRQAEALYPEMVEVVLEVFEASSRAAGGGVRAP